MEKTIRLSEQIIPKYYRPFNDTSTMHKIYTSGRAGTKSSYGAIKAVYKIVSDSDCSVVFIRKFHNKLSKTVYKECIRAIGRLGLPNSDFKITRNPMQITYKPFGTSIYFTGSDGNDDTKGMLDESKHIKLVIIDEVTEFFDRGEGEDELQQIEATFVRGNDEEFCMEYFFNPPKNSRDPVMQWVYKSATRSDFEWIHTDYRDVPTKWLGKKLIDSAEEMRKADEMMYNWVWLGQCVGVPDTIYYMFNEATCVYETTKEDYEHMSVLAMGMDYGQLNATTFQPFGLNFEKKQIQGINEYYYSGRDTQKQKSPSEYAKDFAEFKEAIEKETGKKVLFLFYDPSARGMAEEIKRLCKDIKLVPADNAVDIGITRCQKLFSLGILKLNPRQKNLRNEMYLYKYDENSIEKGKEVPIKKDDHGCDAMRYVVMGLWKYLKALLPNIDIEEKRS